MERYVRRATPSRDILLLQVGVRAFSFISLSPPPPSFSSSNKTTVLGAADGSCYVAHIPLPTCTRDYANYSSRLSRRVGAQVRDIGGGV